MPVSTADPPDWLSDFHRDGYCSFRESALQWLESFPYDFKRDDRSTWTAQHLPYGFTGGLYNRYAVNHEDWVWKVGIQPEIREAFAKVWGTDDLTVSFDGMNATLPINPTTGRTDIQPTAPWPHMDQTPRFVNTLQLCQGIANLSPSGPPDGGLVVLRGSHKLHEDHFDSIGGFDTSADQGEAFEGYKYSMEDVGWYLKHGCEEIKVCANAGDLILWDSRTIRWNASPVGTQTRFALYVAWTPREFMSEVELATKLEIFEQRKGTTGWAHKNVVPTDLDSPSALPRRPDGSVDPANRTRPLQEPVESEEVLWAVRVRE